MTATRGTTNTNQRGSSYARAARRAWLLSTYAANVQVIRVVDPSWEGPVEHEPLDPHSQAQRAEELEAWGVEYVTLATARCFRCGGLLTDETITVDRIIPGCQGGTYRRDNIRPACGPCNSETGGALARRPKGKRA